MLLENITYFYASKSFVKFKTTDILVNKKGVPPSILKKLRNYNIVFKKPLITKWLLIYCFKKSKSKRA